LLTVLTLSYKEKAGKKKALMGLCGSGGGQGFAPHFVRSGGITEE
jgi:hypothetical protein